MPGRIELVCLCAGEFDSPVQLNSNLKAPEGPYSIVLPVCKVCLENGCNIIVRAARQNAEAKQSRIDAAVATETGRKERVVVEAAAATPAATPGATTIIQWDKNVAMYSIQSWVRFLLKGFK